MNVVPLALRTQMMGGSVGNSCRVNSLMHHMFNVVLNFAFQAVFFGFFNTVMFLF